jgi:XamI restriction endonuclease
VKERRLARKSEQAEYKRWLAEYSTAVRGLLAASDYLRTLTRPVLEERGFLDLSRYLAVPPISLDDLDTLTDSCFGPWVGQKTERGARPSAREFTDAARIISSRLDSDRAPWLSRGRRPTKGERETFVKWMASIPAVNKVTTERRSRRSRQQEDLTRAAVGAAGYLPVTPSGKLKNPEKDMEPGTYSEKSRSLLKTNIDVPVRLRTGHATGQVFLAVECKVSNSALNSRKRLLEVNSKRQTWDGSGAVYRVRTAAVLTGVFDVARLVEAQDAGVLIFWEHRLKDLTTFLRRKT